MHTNQSLRTPCRAEARLGGLSHPAGPGVKPGPSSWRRRAAVLALLLPLLSCAADTPPEAAAPAASPGAAEATGRRFMVVTANPDASRAALDILRRGGSAVDAAIAAQAVLTLVEPQSSGIGGGAFLLHWDGVTGKLTAWDGREAAPKSAHADLFLDADGKPLPFAVAALGGRPVGVPGVLRLLETVHRREGRLDWAALFQPAIDLAERGFVVAPRLAEAIAAAKDLKHDPDAAGYYFDAAGAPHGAGAVLRNPELAQTLRTIAQGGADAFYGGALAQAIVAQVNEDGSSQGAIARMSAADLLDYRARERAALCAPYRVYEVCSMGPPTSGGIALLQILGMLGHFNLAPMHPNGAQAMHLLAEASRLAFADRNRYVADEDFAHVPVGGLLDAAYLKARAGQIRPDRSLGEARPGKLGDPLILARASQIQFEPASTSHLVIVDSAGDIVSMTSSIERAFGSQLMVGGFMLNSELTDFSFLPAAEGRLVANRVEPGKRPRSSMTPVIAFDRDGRPAFALGSPGGSSIIGYVAQAVVEIADWGRTPGQAVAAPHVLNRNGPTVVETGMETAQLRHALEALGHEVQESELQSGLAIVRFIDDRMIGAADPRRDGVALGESGDGVAMGE
jgi:gamma-glutamyltranspeptidase/glutathione hydrolase